MDDDLIPDWAIRTKADELAIQQGCYWDQSRADQVLNFTQQFFRSQYITGPIRWRNNQKLILSSIYGWRLPSTLPRFRFANLHVPKKTFGKTLLCSAIAFADMFLSEEPSPRICCCAASKDNASQVWSDVYYSLKNGPFEGMYKARQQTKEIEIEELNAKFLALASDANRLHGPNIITAILDEAAWTQNEQIHNALQFSMMARDTGKYVIISTASNKLNHWYHDTIYQKSKRILDGTDTDITHFAYLSEMDSKGNPDDEAQWFKANPNLDTPDGIPLDRFRLMIQSAKSAGLGDWLNAQRLLLNRWVRADELAWLDCVDWNQHKEIPTEEELRNCAAACSADLSETTDPSSVAIAFDLGDGKAFIRSWAWVANRGADQRRKTELPRFEQYRDEGSMTITEGDRIDDKKILDHILKLCETYDVQVVNFDPRGAYVMGSRVEEEGYKVQRVPQNFRYYNGPMKEFAKAYEQGRIKHDGSTWLKYCLTNVRIEINRYDEIRPFRKKSTDHIDGATSALLAYMGLLTEQETTITQGVLWA